MSLSIPAFHVSDKSKARGVGEVFISSRKDAVASGNFTVRLDVQFDPAVDLYPVGTLTIRADLSDSARGTFTATSIDLINSHGKHNPPVFLTGKCNDDVQPDAKGCRYWVMIANNKTSPNHITPDVVGFAIHDRNGNQIAYGTGPLKSGDYEVFPK